MLQFASYVAVRLFQRWFVSLIRIHREAGAGELYAYVPLNDANAAALQAVPSSHRNPDYGFSVGRGLWTFEAGKWTTVAERVKMNTAGVADGQ